MNITSYNSTVLRSAVRNLMIAEAESGFQTRIIVAEHIRRRNRK